MIQNTFIHVDEAGKQDEKRRSRSVSSPCLAECPRRRAGEEADDLPGQKMTAVFFPEMTHREGDALLKQFAYDFTAEVHSPQGVIINFLDHEFAKSIIRDTFIWPTTRWYTVHGKENITNLFKRAGNASMVLRPSERKGEQAEDKIFVGGLPFAAKDRHLRDYFEKFGRLRQCSVVKDNAGITRKFAYVSFEKPDDSQRCLNFEEHVILGRPVGVRPYYKKDAEEKNPDQPAEKSPPSSDHRQRRR
jgi:RNA recognition motif. (a.k.a. RRM, RBD, or RNP domain)